MTGERITVVNSKEILKPSIKIFKKYQIQRKITQNRQKCKKEEEDKKNYSGVLSPPLTKYSSYAFRSSSVIICSSS